MGGVQTFNYKAGEPPQLIVETPNGTTYSKTQTVNIILNGLKGNSLAKGTYRFYYDFSDEIKSCENLTQYVDMKINSGDKTKRVTISKSDGTGIYNLYLCNKKAIFDTGGNMLASSLITKSVYLDNTLPECTDSGDSTEWTKNPKTIVYGCSDAHSLCASGENGGSQTFSTTTTTASIPAYTIRDNAGNTRNCPIRTANVYVDTSKPNCTVAKTNRGTTDGVTATFTCTDVGSQFDSNSPIPQKTGLKATTTYNVVDKVGNSNTVTVEVTTETQYRNYRCRAYGSHEDCGSRPKSCKEVAVFTDISARIPQGMECVDMCPSGQCQGKNCISYEEKCTYGSYPSCCYGGHVWSSWGTTSCGDPSDSCQSRTIYN